MFAFCAKRLSVPRIRFGHCFLALLACLWCQPSVAQEETKPNFMIILVDDAALMDFGAYGGEARTPNIDALAEKGAMFTQYRTSPLCSPSRAMLLTGMDNHLTGVATIPEVLPPEHKGQPGYSLSFEPGVLTLADRLRPAGYRTLMTGKWHLGSGQGDLPSDHGFDRSFALDASGADNWQDKSYMPYYRDAPWYEDGVAIALPDNFYSSEFIVDKMIEYIGEGARDTPFMAFIGFQAIHIPVQAPPEFTANYDGVYEDGWHALRNRRHQKAIELGLIPPGSPLAPMPAKARNWDSLSDEERTLYVARMQVNAAMMEAMDFHIGRLIRYLKQSGAYENTVFVITSDNGPEPNRGDDDLRLKLWMGLNGYHVGLDGIGEHGSWGFIGPEWANAAASPGGLFKFYTSEGGIRVPMVMAGPDIAPQRVASFAMVSDIAPTLLDMVPSDIPSSDGKPMTGRSLLPVLNGERATTYDTDDAVGIEVSGNAALYKGDYKLTRNIAPVGDGRWRLFNIKTDPGETIDLTVSMPDKKAELMADYGAYVQRVGVLEMPEGYDSARQILRNVLKKQLSYYWWVVLLASIFLLGLIYAMWRAMRKYLFK